MDAAGSRVRGRRRAAGALAAAAHTHPPMAKCVASASKQLMAMTTLQYKCPLPRPGLPSLLAGGGGGASRNRSLPLSPLPRWSSGWASYPPPPPLRCMAEGGLHAGRSKRQHASLVTTRQAGEQRAGRRRRRACRHLRRGRRQGAARSCTRPRGCCTGLAAGGAAKARRGARWRIGPDGMRSCSGLRLGQSHQQLQMLWLRPPGRGAGSRRLGLGDRRFTVLAGAGCALRFQSSLCGAALSAASLRLVWRAPPNAARSAAQRGAACSPGTAPGTTGLHQQESCSSTGRVRVFNASSTDEMARDRRRSTGGSMRLQAGAETVVLLNRAHCWSESIQECMSCIHTCPGD